MISLRLRGWELAVRFCAVRGGRLFLGCWLGRLPLGAGLWLGLGVGLGFVLGVEWGVSCFVWSLGCLVSLVEFLMGLLTLLALVLVLPFGVCFGGFLRSDLAPEKRTP